MFGFFKKTEETSIKPQKDISSHPFMPIVDLSPALTYVTIKFDGKTISIGMKTDTIQESKYALEEVKLLKDTINSIKKEINIQVKEYRASYTTHVANRGVMMPGGGSLGSAFRYLERTNRANARGEVANTIKGIKDTLLTPLDKLILHCDKLKLILQKEIISGVVA